MDFSALHRDGDPLLLPNAWDFATAAALVDAGFAAIGTTSLGVAAAAGVQDGEGLTRAETLDLARRLCRLPVPVTVDLEAGFGAGDRFGALLTAMADAGVAGVNLEDGRPGGTLADPAAQAELIAAAKRVAPSLFVNARVDTHWLGTDRESTLDRVRTYVDAGADGVFVPGMPDAGTIREVVAAVRAADVPVNVLFRQDGPGVAELTAMGVRRISLGSLPFRAALRACVATANAVRDDAEPPPAVSYPDVQRLLARYR